MTFYQIRVGGSLVGLADNEKELWGFYATFFFRAPDREEMSVVLSKLLTTRMKKHGVRHSTGALSSYFYTCSISAPKREVFDEFEDKDTGFTFHKISCLGVVKAIFFYCYLRTLRPWALVKLNDSRKL